MPKSPKVFVHQLGEGYRLQSPYYASPARFQSRLKAVVGHAPTEYSRVWQVYLQMKRDFDALKKENKPKMRRTGEPIYLHPAGVAMMLMEEFGENDPDFLVEALLHDHGEDILWDVVRLGPDNKHWGRILKSSTMRTLLKSVVRPLARVERDLLCWILEHRRPDIISARNALVVPPEKHLFLKRCGY